MSIKTGCGSQVIENALALHFGAEKCPICNVVAKNTELTQSQIESIKKEFRRNLGLGIKPTKTGLSKIPSDSEITLVAQTMLKNRNLSLSELARKIKNLENKMLKNPDAESKEYEDTYQEWVQYIVESLKGVPNKNFDYLVEVGKSFAALA